MAMVVFEVAGLAEHLALLVQSGLSDVTIAFPNPCCVSQAVWVVQVERLIASPAGLADTLCGGFCRCPLG